MYNLLSFLEWDPQLFNRCYVHPDLVDQKEGIINRILEKNWMLMPYVDNPNLFSSAVQTWFKSHALEFKRLWDTMTAEYDPIENYNRYEDSDNKFETSRKQGGKTTESGTIHNDGESTNKISAMNSSGFQNDSNQVVDNTQTNNMSNIVDLTEGGTDTNDYHSHVHGNIGVTTTQEMLQAEREVVKFNLWDYIADKFMDDNMIRVF